MPSSGSLPSGEPQEIGRPPMCVCVCACDQVCGSAAPRWQCFGAVACASPPCSRRLASRAPIAKDSADCGLEHCGLRACEVAISRLRAPSSTAF
eukprot:10979220-Alexandrium_andersonii.AAC.1